jgi:Zn finger protein HypA/HybF involved in hydrogenase expression
MSGNVLAGLAVLIIFVVIMIVSWAIKKFKGDKDISENKVICMCKKCRKVIPWYFTVGDICPHCGVRFEEIVVIRPN